MVWVTYFCDYRHYDVFIHFMQITQKMWIITINCVFGESYLSRISKKH